MKRLEESEVVGHLSHFLIFCQVKVLMKNLGVFAPDKNISIRKKRIKVLPVLTNRSMENSYTHFKIFIVVYKVCMESKAGH